jgi:hypothetical protein
MDDFGVDVELFVHLANDRILHDLAKLYSPTSDLPFVMPSQYPWRMALCE